MRDALVVIDVINDFDHPDGAALLESFRARHDALLATIEDARARDVPVIYVNDHNGRWDWDIPGELRRVATSWAGGGLVARVLPRPGEAFLRKPRYSAFDHTALELLLRELEIERLLLVGAATEMCIVQTAIDAKELGLKVTIIAAACASVDEADAALALEYAERVVGAVVERAPVTRLDGASAGHLPA
jgi:nicotinamidase-related amidase